MYKIKIMGRSKKYNGLNDSQIQKLEQSEEDILATNKRKSISVVIEKDRDIFVNNLLLLNDILENDRKTKSDSIFVIASGKNLIQSLAYLVLNDVFYEEIVLLRKKLGIPAGGFTLAKQYGKWVETHDIKDLLNSTADLIKKYDLCLEKDRHRLVSVLSKYVSLSVVDFKKFFNIMSPLLFEDRIEPVFDINVLEQKENSQDNLYSCRWIYKMHPFVSYTGIENKLKDFYERELIWEKSEMAKNEYVSHLAKKFNTKKHKDKIKSNESLEVIEGNGEVELVFETNFYTKPSDIIKLYKQKQKQIQQILSGLEGSSRDLQKKRLSEQFRRNYRIYKLFKKGLPPDNIYDYVYGESEDVGTQSLNTIKGEVGQFHANIRDSIERKIIF